MNLLGQASFKNLQNKGATRVSRRASSDSQVSKDRPLKAV